MEWWGRGLSTDPQFSLYLRETEEISSNMGHTLQSKSTNVVLHLFVCDPSCHVAVANIGCKKHSDEDELILLPPASEG